MRYSPSDYFQETSDTAVRFLARNDHRNVAKLFQKTGFTCELETQKGTFFESVIFDETDITARITIYWGIGINEEYRSKVEDFAEKIYEYMNGLCAVGIDASGRIFSMSELSYEEKAISMEAFEKAEKICYDALRLFNGAMIKLNCCGNGDEDAFAGIGKAYIQEESENYGE